MRANSAGDENRMPFVVPPDDEGPTEGRTMTIALHATHFTVRNERGELAHRIYMPRNLEGVTVPVRPPSGRPPAATAHGTRARP